MTTTNEREAILQALGVWIAQRPGLEYGNYGDPASYRSEMRRITRQMHDARELLAAVSMRQSITADHLRAAFRAYSGRLTWTPNEAGGGTLDYCTGQYWPTEYRAAACAVLASALWDWYRANLKPYKVSDAPGGYDLYESYGKRGLTFRDAIKRSARMDAGLSRSALGWLD